ALLFGCMLGADTVLSFGPQTTVDLDGLAALGDRRWDEPLGELAAAGELDRRWADLRSALPEVRRADTACRVYFDERFELDRAHAERLADLDGVSLHRVEGGGHNVARQMRESGELEDVLTAALGLSTAAPG